MSALRFAFRQWQKNPGFATVAILTLAIGIGANTVVFSLAKAVLFRSLGIDGADRLMWIQLANTQTGSTEDRVSWQDSEDIRTSAQSFVSLALIGSPGATWEHGGEIEELPALGVTPNLGAVLKVRPALGRMFVPEDAEPSAPEVVLISHELWQSHFGGQASIIGQTLRLNDHSHVVVGVLPRGLQFPLERAPATGTGNKIVAGVQAFWFPMRVSGQDRVARGARMFIALGQLKPGVRESTARAELNELGRRLAREFPETNRSWNFSIQSFRDQVLGPTRRGIPVLAAAVVAVWLVCCVNLANLLLARGAMRQREAAIRLSLGAGRGRLVQALMLENLWLAVLGGGLGFVLASAALQGIRSLASANIPFVREASLGLPSLGLTAAFSLLTLFVFGWLPALRLSRVEDADLLRTGARATRGPRFRTSQHGMLVGQIAIVTVLLASAGLLLESFRRLVGQDLGYKTDSVMVLDLSTRQLATNDEGARFYREIHSHLAAVPGVNAVGTIQSTPLTGRWTFSEKTTVFGRPQAVADQPSLAATFVAFDYFQAMSIPVLSGRYFHRSELHDDDMPPVVVLNEAAVAKLFPGVAPVGQRIAFANRPERYYEVIGVVRDTRDVRLDHAAEPRFYLNFTFGGAQFAVRSSAPPHEQANQLRDALRHFGNRIVVHDIRPLQEIVSATVAERRFFMVMLTAYAVAALAIASVGIFGIVACQVGQRTNEFGIRLALGSSPAGLLRLVLLQSGWLVLSGLAIGLPLSLASGQQLASQVFGLSPYDPRLLLTVSATLFIVALLATYLPARRAAATDPVEALRSE